MLFENNFINREFKRIKAKKAILCESGWLKTQLTLTKKPKSNY